MKAFWTDTRPNGQPVESGTVCWVTDLEDGTHPIYTYGRDQGEVLEKLARQNANAQIALVRKSSTQSSSAAAQAPPPPRQISADQVMQATVDLEDPAKAGQAISTLVESATGLNLQQIVIDNYARMALQWQTAHPEFFPHPGNKQLLTAEALQLAGGSLGKVTAQILTQAMNNLKAQGLLMEDQGEPITDQPSSTFPDETQVQRIERPRGTRFATGSRSTTFQRQTAPTRTLKYTAEEIRTMPLSKQKALLESNDREYAEACEFHFGSSAQATA
jgi:hypothetical protein